MAERAVGGEERREKWSCRSSSKGVAVSQARGEGEWEKEGGRRREGTALALSSSVVSWSSVAGLW